jgi:dihydrofolate reductase
MYVFGSANLSETFIKDDLFDEYRIGIAPVMTGKGRYLFPKDITQKKLSLISSQPLTTGGIVLRYQPLKSEKI